jgi:predicted nicotinamide N-methyase
MPPRTPAELAAFVRERTAPGPVALVPEIEIQQATDVTPLWHATAAELKGWDESPFWAFPWAGGQALARHVLDHPELARGQVVLDLATGSGLCAIAAARAGAARVVASDVDPFCAAVVPINVALNGLAPGAVEVRIGDLLSLPPEELGLVPGLVLAGDIFYDRGLTERGLPWLRRLAGLGARVLAGDPGRNYTPREGLREIAAYEVPTSLDIEEQTLRRTGVLEVPP